MTTRILASKACLAALLLLGTACPGETSDEPVEAPVTPAPTSQPSASPTPSKELTQPSAQQVPVSADFEAEAETAIDARTYKKELEALSRQIDQEGVN